MGKLECKFPQLSVRLFNGSSLCDRGGTVKTVCFWINLVFSEVSVSVAPYTSFVAKRTGSQDQATELLWNAAAKRQVSGARNNRILSNKKAYSKITSNGGS